jgi:hypothetical protein
MNRRLFLSLTVLAALAGAAWLVLCLTSPKLRIDEASLWLIKEGMTLEEVEEILGGPPGNYGSRPKEVDFPWSMKRPEDALVKEWYTDEFWVGVFFDKSNRVLAAEGTGGLKRASFFERFCRSLGLR